MVSLALTASSMAAEPDRVIAKFAAQVYKLQYSRDGKLVLASLSGSRTGMAVMVWNVEDGTKYSIETTAGVARFHPMGSMSRVPTEAKCLSGGLLTKNCMRLSHLTLVVTNAPSLMLSIRQTVA